MQRGLEDLKVLGVEGTVEKWLWKEVVGGRKERRDPFVFVGHVEKKIYHRSEHDCIPMERACRGETS